MAHPNKKESEGSADKKLRKMAQGGRMSAGSESGEGRLQKSAKQRNANIRGEGSTSKLRADKPSRRKGGKIKYRADGGSVMDDPQLLASTEGVPPMPDQGPVGEGPQSGAQKLFGINGPRTQLAPERMVRSALTLPGDVFSGKTPVVDPETGHTSDEVISRAQDMSGLAGSGGMPMAGVGALGMAGGKLGKNYVKAQEMVRGSQALSDQFVRKPASWREVDRIVNPNNPAFDNAGRIPLGAFPKYEAHDLLKNPAELLSSFISTPKATVFRMTRDGKEYLVNTEGFDYPRYVMRTK